MREGAACQSSLGDFHVTAGRERSALYCQSMPSIAMRSEASDCLEVSYAQFAVRAEPRRFTSLSDDARSRMSANADMQIEIIHPSKTPWYLILSCHHPQPQQLIYVVQQRSSSGVGGDVHVSSDTKGNARPALPGTYAAYIVARLAEYMTSHVLRP
jgi:hypothetical protein